MESINLDSKIKAALESFVWDQPLAIPEPDNTPMCYNSLLHQIGCDQASILMEILSPERNKTEIQETEKPSFQLDYHPQPRFSGLTQTQHQQYLLYLEKYKNIAINTNTAFLSLEEKQSLTEYKVLQRKVLQEQHEFNDYAFQVALRSISNYDCETAEANKYFQQYLTRERKRLQHYLEKYVFHEKLLINLMPYTKDPQPIFEGHCITQGKPKLLMTPDVDTNVPPFDSAQAGVHLDSISEDKNAEKLALAWNANIVISLSALRTLAANFPPFNKEWEMPMIIKHLEGSDGAARNVLFIDKSLPPMSVNGRDKMQRYFKKALKQFLYKMSTPLNETSDEEEEETSGSDESRNLSDATPHQPRTNRRNGTSCSDLPFENLSSSKTDEDVSSDVSNQAIPQLDGIDDGATATKRKTPKRKARTSSNLSKQKPATAVKLNVWQSSVEKFEKSDVRAKSTVTSGSAGSLALWSVPKKDEAPTSDVGFQDPVFDSEDDNLVIDSAAETEPDQTVDASVSTNPERDGHVSDEEEQPQLSFKATHIPSNILESVLDDDAERESNHSDSGDVTPLRRSTRKRSKSKSDCEKTPAKKQPLKSAAKKRKATRSAATDAPPTRRTSARSKKAPEPPAKTSDEFSTDDDEVLSKSVLKANLRSAASDKPTSSKSSPSKESGSAKSSTVEKETCAGDAPASVAVAAPKDNDETRGQSSIEIPAEKTGTQSAIKTNTPKKTGISFIQQVTVRKATAAAAKPKSANDSKARNERGKSATASSDTVPTGTSIPPEARTAERNLEESGDILGQILNMQRSRPERVASHDPLEPRKVGFPQQTVLPSIPAPMQNFDAMLQLHTTKLHESGKEVFYSLWSLGSFRILIRGCLHGKIKQKFSANNKDKFEMKVGYVTIRAKLEYQSDLGYEQLSTSEACAEWLDLQFRPQPSSVLRCRINPYLNKILRFDRVRNVKSTYKAYEAAGFNYLKANKLLLSVFQKLVGKKMYEEGSYLISHKFGANEFAVRKSRATSYSKMVFYDLHREYANPGRPVLCTPQTIPWNPLDPAKQTAWQFYKRRVPMMFDPKPKGLADAGKKSKKGKKKRKKTVDADEDWVAS